MLIIKVDNEIDLKVLDLSDAENLFRLTDSCRDYLREWLPWLDVTRTVEDTKGFIEGTLDQLESNNGFQMGIWYRGQLVGVLGHLSVDRIKQSAPLGYWLGKDFQGQGVMTRCCKALIDYTFDELGVNRVEIRCAVGNFKSRAIPEGLGFQNEGLVQEVEWLYDHYVSHVIYGILKRDWGKH